MFASVLIGIAKVCDVLRLRRIITTRDNSAWYMIRYYLFSTRFLAPIFPSLSGRLVLHRVLRSDEDGLHDHPWRWRARIIRGGYWERTPMGRFWRDSSMGWRSGQSDDFHRLELDPNHSEKMTGHREVWSLFWMGPKFGKKWGFLAADGYWVESEEYFANRDKYVLT